MEASPSQVYGAGLLIPLGRKPLARSNRAASAAMSRHSTHSLGRARSGLYRAARLLGDVQAIQRSARTGSAVPIARRMERRVVGRAVGKNLRRLGL